jgi:uncharacterized protein YdhG (YjbR/CyaY superfamily)
MNKNPDVDDWLAGYDNPMKPVVSAIRDHILASDPRITEAIKWQAPTFVYKGNIASFFPKAKKHASLMFHKGADFRGAYSYLEGGGKETRSLKVRSLEDLAVKAEELSAICVAWCDMRDSA